MLASLTRQIPAAGPNNQRWRSAVCRASSVKNGAENDGQFRIKMYQVSNLQSSNPWQSWVPTHFLQFQQTSAKMSLSETRVPLIVLILFTIKMATTWGAVPHFGVQRQIYPYWYLLVSPWSGGLAGCYSPRYGFRGIPAYPHVWWGHPFAYESIQTSMAVTYQAKYHIYLILFISFHI